MGANDFSKVLKYIDEHIYEKISLKELADLVGYNPFYFIESFSSTYGIPVSGYMRIKKLQYALHSLLEGKKALDKKSTLINNQKMIIIILARWTVFACPFFYYGA